MPETKNTNKKKKSFLSTKKGKIVLAAIIAVVVACGCIVAFVPRTTNTDNTANKTAETTKPTASENAESSKITSLENKYSTALRKAESYPANDNSADKKQAYTDAINAGNELLTARKEALTTYHNDVDEEREKNKINDLQKEIDQLNKTADSIKVDETVKPTEKADETKKDDKKTTIATAKPTAKATQNNSSTSQNQKNQQATTQKKSCTPTRKYVVDRQAYDENVVTGYRTVVDKQAYDETVVDQQAYTETVTTGDVFVCNDCGARFNTVEELNDHADIVHDNAANYHIEPITKTVTHPAVTHIVHHEAVTHQEPIVQKLHHDATGHYENVGC